MTLIYMVLVAAGYYGLGRATGEARGRARAAHRCYEASHQADYERWGR